MEQVVFSYKKSSIHYYRFGTGPHVVLCFHGYGEEGNVYSFMEKTAGNQHSLYAIDLPFHGKTVWNEERDFTKEDLKEIIKGITETGKNPKDRITILGFSLGARIALSFYEAAPARVEKLVLMAPDGLKVNPWYWLATQTRAGNWFFALTMKHPNWFLGFLKMLNRLGFVNTSIFKFVNYYIADKKVREDLYNRWTGLRRFKPDLHHIKSLILQHKTPVRLLYGRHDRIILSARGEKFKKGIEDYCSLIILPAGHQVLQEKYEKEIWHALTND